jgi:hypothetical protein
MLSPPLDLRLIGWCCDLQIQPRSTLLEALVDPFDMLHIPDRQLRLFAKKKLADCEQRCKQEKVPMLPGPFSLPFAQSSH